jgi:hypothetical protein
MRTMLLLVAVAATLAVTADAASSKTFVSKRYGYSIVLRGDWTLRPASIPWEGGPPFMYPSGVDSYEAADGRSLAVAARLCREQRYENGRACTSAPRFRVSARSRAAIAPPRSEAHRRWPSQVAARFTTST